mgnify:CR=1 FL=1
MKIFIIARGYPSKQEPTWGCFEKDQAEALSQSGHQVTILSVDTRFRFYWRTLGIHYTKENNITAYNIFVFPYALLFLIPKQFKNWFYTLQLELLYKHVVQKEGKPDILYSHYLHNTYKALRIHKKYNIPLVGIEHWSQMAFQPISKETITLAKQVYSSIDSLITVSSALRDNIFKQIGFNSIVIPNMVGSEFYFQENLSKNSTIRIISTGRLVFEKRFDLLISAMANIHQPFELNIIGNGPEKNKLQQLIHKHHLEDQIHLLGYKTKPEIVQLLQNSDLFILPSQSETFGVAYIEALACGLPIIATDCGGPRDIVTKENGLLVPINDLESLSISITYMINNINHYNRQAIAADCISRFSSKSIAQQLTKVFENTYKKTKFK